MRFYGIKDEPISVDKIANWLQTAFIDGEIESEEEEKPGSWSTLTLYLDNGEAVVEIEKLCAPDEEFVDAIQDTVRFLLDDKEPVKPASAVKWLCQFMGRVKVLYEFRPMLAVTTDEGWQIFNEVWTNLRHTLTGIVHLQDEGFTNEEGAQITWEYPENADLSQTGESGDEKGHMHLSESAGDLKVAVMDEDSGKWIDYTINLADPTARLMFINGKRPET
jgi:hypothetical protein